MPASKRFPGVSTPDLAAVPTAPFDGGLAVPARVRPISSREVRQLDLPGVEDPEEDDGRFWFTAEISSTAIDAYHTHMMDSTLRNFARDAAAGVSLLDSHDGRKLGVGYSAGGRYEEEGGEGRALGLFYIVPGLRFGGTHSFASTDDYIRAVEVGVVRDVSVGFYGGRWVCDVCHQPYFGSTTTCQHIAGWEYEVEIDGELLRVMCTVAIHDANLSEVSLVYDGATPGAMILKAEQEAEAGRLSPAMIRQLERRYRTRLAMDESAVWPVVGVISTSTASSITFPVNGSGGRSSAGERNMELDEELNEIEVGKTEGVVEGAAAQDASADDSADNDAAEEEMRTAVIAVRRALRESGADEGVPLDAAVRGLSERLATAERERDAARQEIARLQPLADQGRAYHEDLVNQAIGEGVRAMGEAFPEETYRAMLAAAPLDHIRQIRDTFAAQAAERFPGGRLTRDKNENGKEAARPATPAAAYGA